MARKIIPALLFVAALLCSCAQQQENQITLLDKSKFTAEIEGQEISLYTIESGKGLTAQITNYGGRIVSLWAPDKEGKYADLVLGFDNITDYMDNKGSERFLGPVVGRYANRIANGKFEIDGVAYQLPQNDKTNTLHGGIKGLDSQVWTVNNVTKNTIEMAYTSPDGDEGFPGTVAITMTYTLTENNELKIDYKATTDKPTHLNLTNHSQFNLKGMGNGTIDDHILTVYADSITPVDTLLIPTGQQAAVENTPFDFRTPETIGKRIGDENEQLKMGGGYDHNWVLNHSKQGNLDLAVRLQDPESGRIMEVYTDQPGIQIYTGNFFKSTVVGKYGKTLDYRGAIALETQKYPDTPNQPNFPTTRVNPGETYTHTCIYQFSVTNELIK